MSARGPILAMLLLIVVDGACAADDAAVRIRFVDDRTQAEITADGRVLVEATDGGVLLEDRAGTLWSITPHGGEGSLASSVAPRTSTLCT